MHEDLVTIQQSRLALVSARSDLRVAQDDLRRTERACRREAIATLTQTHSLASNAAERKQQIEDWIEEDDTYQAALTLVRRAEKRSDLVQANLENATMVIRQQEWFIRERLADAIAEYSTRPCAGIQEHTIVDTLIDSTGDHGVFGGESRYIRDATRVA